MVRFLRRLVLAESPSWVPESLEGAFALLTEGLTAAGYRVRRVRGASSAGQLLAVPEERARGRGAQLLLGHVDTVWGLGAVEGMPVELRDGRLHGPGVYDMKGGLVQGIYALRALHDLGYEPPLAPVFLITSDEELGSADSVRTIQRVARRMKRAFVLEPSLGPTGKLKTRRKGGGVYRITVRGRAAHAGLDAEDGASAIHELAGVIQRLCSFADPDRGIAINVGIVRGGVSFNVVAPEATAEVDFRVERAADAAELDRKIRALRPTVPGTRIEVERTINRLPFEGGPGTEALWRQARQGAGELGLALEEGFAGGTSDASSTAPWVPTIDGLGAVGGGAHAKEEFVYVDRLPERAALLAVLLLAECAQEPAVTAPET